MEGIKVVFITKATYSVGKQFRLIAKITGKVSGHSHQCKGRPTVLSDAHNAFWKGKSTETSLHKVIGCLVDSMQRGEYSLAAFLEIDGAFNNMKSSSQSLPKKKGYSQA